MKYTVSISERSRQMLGQHIQFLAQVNRNAAAELKKAFPGGIPLAGITSPAVSLFQC